MLDRILATADKLFYSQGLRAVGVDMIAAEAGISKRTLYNYFPSKDHLIVAYLEGRMPPRRATDEPPRIQIRKLFDRIERGISNPGFRGCPFVNAVAELGLPDHPARKIAIDMKEELRLWFRARLTEAGLSNPDRLATQLAILVDGMVATALVRGNADLASNAKYTAETLMDQAGL